jgi:cell division septation protein DedD
MGGRGSKTALTASSASPGAASKPVTAPPKTSSAQPATAFAAQSGNPGANPAAIQPSQSSAGQSASQLMVQIAVVSHQEDAEVLVSALHKRGYAVALSQDDADGQFHVRVGPFSSLTEANTMRQKLLNDGYNAVLQP